ncbi:MAG: hypothetical protein D6719_12905 [Candidatus Dadabacteria bacterium]|nr:MAG: hypothetical protein D6719_12905 [Candidatus Dadabacteria bacterium]
MILRKCLFIINNTALVCVLMILFGAGCSKHSAKEGAVGSTGAVHVVFDQSMNQIVFPFDNNFEGMGQLTAELRKNGATVSLNNQNLKEFLSELSPQGSVLVLGIGWGSKYSEPVKKALDKFLQQGGGIMVIGDQDNLYGSSDFHNAFIGRYGLKLLPYTALARGVNLMDRETFWPRSESSWGHKNVRPHMPGVIRVKSDAKILLEVSKPANPDRKIVAAAVTVGKGRLAVIADNEMFTNMVQGAGINAGDNKKFLLKLFFYLTARRPAAAVRPRIKDAYKRGNKLALFDSSAGGWFPDGAPNGLNSFADALNQRGYRIQIRGGEGVDYSKVDLLICVAPLRPLPEANKMMLAKKLLLIGDGRSGLLRAMPKVAQFFHTTADSPRFRYPLNDLAEKVYIKFLPVSLAATSSGGLRTEARWTKDKRLFSLYKAGSIALHPKFQRSMKVHAYGLQLSYPVLNFFPESPASSVLRNPELTPFLPGGSEKLLPARWPIVVEYKNVIAVSELELVTDQSAGTEEFKRIVKLVSG